MVQGELFREEIASPFRDPSEARRGKSFLARHQLSMALDKFLLGLIGFVIVFVLTYSFGVEHGKRAMEKRFESLVLTQSETVAAPSPVLDEPAMGASVATSKGNAVLIVDHQKKPLPKANDGLKTQTVGEEKSIVARVSSEPLAGQAVVSTSVVPSRDLSRKEKFTVQLVTYSDQSQAIKEIERLKTNGHEGFVIPSGRYFQVCVNYFENQAGARSSLKELRETGRYPDAYVRPVVR